MPETITERIQRTRDAAARENLRGAVCPDCGGSARVTQRNGEQRTCNRCNGSGIEWTYVPPIEPRHESVRLFESVPNVMPGQLGFGE